MTTRKEIVDVFDVKEVSETYPENVQITDLREELGTQGRVLVVRGDLAYAHHLGENKDLANPKFWMYENLINSARVQEQLRANPNHKLFDGVGFSSLEALGYHANRIGRKAVVVMPHIFVPDSNVFERYDIEVIRGDKFAEEGYIKKQIEVLSQRDDLIPMHQALYGAQALAPIGNKVVERLEEMCIAPDETFWCLASGSNLYGIGEKIRKRFGSITTVVEPRWYRSIDPDLDLSDKLSVKEYAKAHLKNYSNADWDGTYHLIAPLHVKHPNRYLLLNWLQSGITGFDKAIGIDENVTRLLQETLRILNSDHDWSNTTALTLVPAIEAAREGKDVLVMAYGRRESKHRIREGVGRTPKYNWPWILRWETPAQKVALTAASLAMTAAGAYYALNVNPRAPSFMIN